MARSKSDSIVRQSKRSDLTQTRPNTQGQRRVLWTGLSSRDSSNASVSETDTLQANWQTLEEGRLELDSHRETVVESRTRARAALQIHDEAYLALRQTIERCQCPPSTPHASWWIELLEHIEEVDRTRDENLNLQKLVADLERDLTIMERSLNLTERYYIHSIAPPAESSRANYSLTSFMPNRRLKPTNDAWRVPEPSTELLKGIAPTRNPDLQPEYLTLLSAVAERQDAEEAYRTRSFERSIVIQQEEEFSIILDYGGRTLNNEQQKAHAANTRFLFDFTSTEKVLTTAIKLAKERVVALKARCIARNAMPSNRPFNEVIAIQPDIGDDRSIDLEESHGFVWPHRPPQTRFCRLAPTPRCLLADPPQIAKVALKLAVDLPLSHAERDTRIKCAMEDLSLETLSSYSGVRGNKLDFVNRWLLQNVRVPAHAVEMLFAYRSEPSDLRGSDLWQQQVLHFWKKDDLDMLVSVQISPEQSASISAVSRSEASMRSGVQSGYKAVANLSPRGSRGSFILTTSTSAKYHSLNSSSVVPAIPRRRSLNTVGFPKPIESVTVSRRSL